MASPTVEDYVKQIYLEQQRTGGEVAAMGRLAEAMQVTPGTATSMMKTLAKAGLVDYQPRNGAGLTENGRQLALHILRRHRLLELFLVQTLGLDWAEVHDEAERLEHVISDRLLKRIDEHLDHPRVDPHGDPIPSPRGKVAAEDMQRLTLYTQGQKVKIARIEDQSPGFLRFIDRRALAPGAVVTVTGKDLDADAMELRLSGKCRVTIGLAAAEKILVREI